MGRLYDLSDWSTNLEYDSMNKKRCSKSSYNTYRRSSLKETSSNEASSYVSTSRDSSASRDSTTSSETASSVAKTSDATFQPPKSNDVLTKFRNLWWSDGNIHPSANWDEAS
ncbi:4968_t:CDS:2, partial [Funneliformis mosseae]